MEKKSESGINIPDHLSDSLVIIFCDKNIAALCQFNVADPDPAPFRPWIRDGKIRIRKNIPNPQQCI
jgi:hypothetical protein